MSALLIQNAAALVTCDESNTVHTNCDLLAEGQKITAIGKNIPPPPGAEILDASGCFVYPGLINTHHHLIQAFTRSIPEVQNAELFDWLKYLYEIWRRVDEEFVYYSALTAMAEFVMFGGTTLFDQHFAFPRQSSKTLIDRQFAAAAKIGLRFHAGRSCFTRGKDKGGLPPEDLVESVDEVLADSERLVKTYHDPGAFSMRQVALAPCSPFSVDSDVMLRSARLARSLGVRLHTHLCETLDEERYCLEVYGKRPLDWAFDCEFAGPDVWYAHGIHFTDDEVRRLAGTKTGVSHNPVSNMKLASGVCKVPLMLSLGVPVGLAVDGSASNDASNLLADLRVCFLLHRLVSSTRAPGPAAVLRLATRGGAEILGREDIGSLETGKACDLFLIDVSGLESAGATLDPAAYPCAVGSGRPTRATVIAGKVVWDGRRLTTLTPAEYAALTRAAQTASGRGHR